MDNKLFNYDSITLDGRLDEPVWDMVEEHTGFRRYKLWGGDLDESQTYFKILPCHDRVYFGIKCMDSYMETTKSHVSSDVYFTNNVELFLSPSGSPFQFYHFVLTFDGQKASNLFYENGSNTQAYFPTWNGAVYAGEDYWSVEIELPLTAFYMTDNENWSDKWLVNILRNKAEPESTSNKTHGCSSRGYTYITSSWCIIDETSLDPRLWRSVGGFPIRPDRSDLCVSDVLVDIEKHTDIGYLGLMKVTIKTAAAGTFAFSTGNSEPTTITLKAGANTVSVPCFFESLINYMVSIELKRTDDGETFKFFYPVTVTYEPIRLKLTMPEYRGNFYPGQDYSKVMGLVNASQQVTLKLEGPGINTQIITPNSDGSFEFDTSNFEVGDALLSISADAYQMTQKIRRLAPSGHMMTWISGGNLVVNGEPVLRRNMFCEYWGGGEAFKRRYDSDNLHQTKPFKSVAITPFNMIPESVDPGGEARKDIMPSEAMLRKVDEVIEANKDRDFAHYYLCDEPETSNLSCIYLKNLYSYIADKDPYHVVSIASTRPGRYADSCDLMETDPYIVPRMKKDGSRTYALPIHKVGTYIDAVAQRNRPDKCIGFLPTCFAYKWHGSSYDYPNFDELICHTWVAMMHGAKTLWPYAYHDLNDRPYLYEGIRYIFSTFEALEKIILFGKRKVLLKSTETEAVLFNSDGESIFVLANLTQEPKIVTLDGIDGEWYEFRHNRIITQNVFNMKPHEVIVGTSKIKDAALPTYDDTVSLIEKLEYERTHSGSLLFGREDDVDVTFSKNVDGGWKHKLFNGVKDNLAMRMCEGEEGYCELNLKVVKPSFNKVVVYGYHVENLKVKVRNEGELSVPAISEIKHGELSTTIILKGNICPDALRLEFNRDGCDVVELYEIEVF